MDEAYEAPDDAGSRRRLLPYAVGVGLIAAWALLFHEIGYRFFALMPSPFAEQLVQANCTVNALGAAAGGLLVLSAARLPKDVRRAFEGALASRRAVALAGLALTAVFWACSSASQVEGVLLVEFASSAYGTLLLLNCLTALAGLSLPQTALVGMVAVAVQAPLAGALIPAVQSADPDAAPFVVLALILAAFCALMRFDSSHLLSTSDGNLPPLFGGGAPSRVKVSKELFIHVAAFFFVLGIAHIFISVITESPFSMNASRILGFAVAAALVHVAFVRQGDVAFPWPFVRSHAFPLAMFAFLTLPLIWIASSVHVYVIPIFFTQASASFYEVFVLLMVLYVAREAQVPPISILAQVAVVKGAATALGVVAGSCFINLPIQDKLLASSLFAMAAFLVLCMGTFWVGDDILVRKAWGMRPKRTPRQFRDAELEGRVHVLSERYALTKKEQEVLLMLAHGKRPHQIADEMVVAVNTTRSHIRSLYAKMGLHSFDDLDALLKNSPKG